MYDLTHQCLRGELNPQRCQERMMRTIRWSFFIGALTVCCAANAQVLFTTGFEPPTYTTLVPLNSQNGWACPANATVESRRFQPVLKRCSSTRPG
jgi:hypothetical protein